MTENLKQFSQDRGITQTKMADDLGLSQEYVNRIFTGKVPMSDAFIGKFVQVYGLDAYVRVFGSPSPTEAQR